MQLDGLEPPGPEPTPSRLPVEDLGVYESHGGHTLRRHVDTQPGEEVRRILDGGVRAAGRFLDRPTAQHAVELAIAHHRRQILSWLRHRTDGPRLSFVADMGAVIGDSLTRADVEHGIRTPSPVTGVRVVLRRDATLRGGFTVVTAYPTRPRPRSLTSSPAAA